MGVHKLFISHPRIMTLYLLLFIWGGRVGDSSVGRQETPDAAGHSVFLTCVNGLANQYNSSNSLYFYLGFT